MTIEPPRPQPTSTVQVAGQAATDVIGGLKQSPALLAMVVLNVLAIGLAVWFLRGLQESQAKRVDHLLSLVEKCMSVQPTRP